MIKGTHVGDFIRKNCKKATLYVLCFDPINVLINCKVKRTESTGLTRHPPHVIQCDVEKRKAQIVYRLFIESKV